MEVVSITPRGYCYGVVNAIDVAKKARLQNPEDDIYILGMIVHNKYLVSALDKYKIITLDDTYKSRLDLVDEIDHGVVVLSAHGSDPKVKIKAEDKGLIVYDATCKDVTKTHNIVIDHLLEGYDVIYYGKENHPEAISVLALGDKIHLVTNVDDIKNLDIDNDKIFITNQTTISYLDALEIFAKVKEKYPNVVIADEVCDATRVRQQAILDLDDRIEAVYIVGDPKSNNSNKLAQLAAEKNKKSYLIETVNDIDIEDLKKYDVVGVSSGASTPTYLTNQVIAYLKAFDKNNLSTYPKPSIELEKII